MWLSVSWASSRSLTLKVSSSHPSLHCSGGRWCAGGSARLTGHLAGLGQVLGELWTQQVDGGQARALLGPALQLQLVPHISPGLTGGPG